MGGWVLLLWYPFFSRIRFGATIISQIYRIRTQDSRREIKKNPGRTKKKEVPENRNLQLFQVSGENNIENHFSHIKSQTPSNFSDKTTQSHWSNALNPTQMAKETIKSTRNKKKAKRLIPRSENHISRRNWEFRRYQKSRIPEALLPRRTQLTGKKKGRIKQITIRSGSYQQQ